MDAVNRQTGEVFDPVAELEAIRELEADVVKREEYIASCADLLKAAKEERDEAITELRKRVRGTEPLPLFDGPKDTRKE
jgi:hypothetical protein